MLPSTPSLTAVGSTMSDTTTFANPAIAPVLPLDILAYLCSTLAGSELSTLSRLTRANLDLRNTAIPHLYRLISLNADNFSPFFDSLRNIDGRTHGSTSVHTRVLHIASLPDTLYETTISFFTAPLTSAKTGSSSSSFPFAAVHSLTIESKAIWQLIVHYHTHSTHHPLITYLSTHLPSIKHLSIQYPTVERTKHSFGGGFCCCLAAVRAFQENPIRAAAYDTTSVPILLSALSGRWGELESVRLIGVVDEGLPLDLRIKVEGRLQVEWASCQCANEHFHGEWCFNHVYPWKRVEQVKRITQWADEKGVKLDLRGVGNVGWTDKKDMEQWVMDRVTKDSEHISGDVVERDRCVA